MRDYKNIDLEINMSNLHLTRPCMEYMDSFKEALAEYMLEGVRDFAYPKVDSRWDVKRYLKRLKRLEAGKVVGHVASTSFWLVDGTNYIASGDIRHSLNERLRMLGGNISYGVRPGAWGLGIGTLNLDMLLKEAAKLGVSEPLITCYEGNLASRKIIEKSGGVLMREVFNNVEGEQKLTRIYKIETSSPFVSTRF